MPNPPDIERKNLNLTFTALSEAMRRDMIEIICAEPNISVNELCARFTVSRFTIMRHLNILEEAQLLNRKRQGKHKQLHINNQNFKKIASGWLEKIGNSKPQFYDQDAKRKTNNVQLT